MAIRDYNQEFRRQNGRPPINQSELEAWVVSQTTSTSPSAYLDYSQRLMQGWEMGPLTAVESIDPPRKKVTIKKSVVTFESVVLAEDKREQIKAAISQIDNTELIFEQWGFASVFEKGTAVSLLFYGVPGTGKTLMAEAIANSLGAELKIYGNAEIQSSEPGGAERAIKKMFQTAKEFFTANKKQQVILLDECDALLFDRAKVGAIMGAQINTLLTEIERHDGVVIFTTNRIQTLDPALERRISAKIEFPFPDIMQRKAIWERMIPKKAPIAKDVDYVSLAGYVLAGGNIKNAVLNATRMAAYKKHKEITMDDFASAAQKEVDALKIFEKPKEQFARKSIGYGEDIGVSEGSDYQSTLVLTDNIKERSDHGD